MSTAITILPVHGVGEIRPGDELGDLFASVLGQGAEHRLLDGDVLVVTQKVVSKSEGRIVALDHHDPAAKVALVESEATRVLRRRGDLLITETAHGFICANAGIDLSNVEDGTAALLPVDPDRSARRIRGSIDRQLGVSCAVVISDTFGRPWRSGVTDIAIGAAGLQAVVDLRGTEDAMGRELQATEVCVADEIAGAAELVMGKASGIPAAIVRGVPAEWLGEGSVLEQIVRPNGEDLFR